MIALLCFLLTLFASPLKSRSRLEAENAALRYRLIVLRRKVRGRIRLSNGDRLVFNPAILMVSVAAAGHHRHPSRDARALASGRLSLLLALEIALAGRAPADQRGTARFDSAHEHREPAVGRAAYPW
jgi:hypothetical protein